MKEVNYESVISICIHLQTVSKENQLRQKRFRPAKAAVRGNTTGNYTLLQLHNYSRSKLTDGGRLRTLALAGGVHIEWNSFFTAN